MTYSERNSKNKLRVKIQALKTRWQEMREVGEGSEMYSMGRRDSKCTVKSRKKMLQDQEISWEETKNRAETNIIGAASPSLMNTFTRIHSGTNVEMHQEKKRYLCVWHRALKCHIHHKAQANSLWAIAFELWALINYLILVTLVGKYLLFHPLMRKSKTSRNRARGYINNLCSKLDTTLNHNKENHYFELHVKHWGELSIV